MQTSNKDHINVLVAAKINEPLTYEVTSFSEPIELGSIVRVPLGNRTVSGIVTNTEVETTVNISKEIKLKPISDVLSTEFKVPKDLLTLLNWCQRYYHAPIGQIISAALPKSILNGKPVSAKSSCKWTTKNAPLEDKISPTTKQAEARDWILKNGPATTTEIISAGFGRHLVAALNKKGLIEEVSAQHIPAPEKILLERPQKLNPDQQSAVDHISYKENDSSFYLLNGVTGSGKTEVYLQVAEKLIAHGGQALILVPEIGLVNQTINRVKQRFGVDVMAYHSNTAESEKIQCWKACSQLETLIVVGTRSSILLPFSNLKLIVVDEEQDLSYKQHEGFRYNARDIALVRAKSANASLILGSATPSIESLKNANRGVLAQIHLKNRIGHRPMPRWQFYKPESRSSVSALSKDTLNAIAVEIEAQNQVLVFLNRRGFAPLIQCANCGWTAKCNACDTSMTVHRNPSSLICHRCDRRRLPPHNCPDCRSTKLQSIGLGTEQVESFLQGIFHNIPCLRIDRDSTQTKGSFNKTLSKLKQGNPAILIGTQMITKGHHLPGISLVVVLEADSALLSHDFRAIEHMAQSLTQVAGRAGRGHSSGQIIVETEQPEHPVFSALAQSSYAQFSAGIIEARQSQSLPPYRYSALIHANSYELGLLQQFMGNCFGALSSAANQSNVTQDEIELIGPMPSPIEKRNNRFRYQIQVYSASRPTLHTAISSLEYAISQMKGIGKIRVGIDIDPLTMD